MTMQEGPTSRKYCKYRTKRLSWKYCSGCLCNNVVIVSPPTPQSEAQFFQKIQEWVLRQKEVV